MAVISLLNLPTIAPADTGTTQAPDDTSPPRNPCRAVAFWTVPIALSPAPKNRFIPINKIGIEKDIYHRRTISMQKKYILTYSYYHIDTYFMDLLHTNVQKM